VLHALPPFRMLNRDERNGILHFFVSYGRPMGDEPHGEKGLRPGALAAARFLFVVPYRPSDGRPPSRRRLAPRRPCRRAKQASRCDRHDVLRALTFDMRGGRQLAKPDVARPLDGRVRALLRGIPQTALLVWQTYSRKKSTSAIGHRTNRRAARPQHSRDFLC
jgi:hypothetical protein